MQLVDTDILIDHYQALFNERHCDSSTLRARTEEAMIRYPSKRTTIRRKARSAGLSHNRRRFSTDAAPHLLFGARRERGNRQVLSFVIGSATILRYNWSVM